MLRRWVQAGLIVLVVAGCSGSKMPSLNRVKGHVTRNGTPVEFVSIHLVPETEMPDFSVMGLSDASGDFDVYTLERRTNRRKSGAPEGTYSIRVVPPMDEKQHAVPEFTVPQKFAVQKGDNTLPNIDIGKK
jgi:predicted transglutaminase-like cysteine proteinase